MALSNRVRELREAAGKTIAEVGAEVGMDKSMLSKVERGERGCPDEKKLALAAYFNVPLTAIFFVRVGDTKSPSEAEAVPA